MASEVPQVTQVRIDQQGRLVIPADMRRSLGLECGEEVTLVVEEGVLQVITLDQAIRRAQDIALRHTGGKPGLVDEFIADRRRDSGD